MRIKYIRNVGFDFDIAQWIADSELVSDDDCQYFMRYRDLDCWRVMVKQEDFAPEVYVIVIEGMNAYLIACEDDVLTEETLQAFIRKTFDSIEYDCYNDELPDTNS